MPVEIKDIFQLAIDKSASDVLITVGAPPCIRVNGHLAFAKSPRLTPEETKQMVYSVLDGGQIAEFEREKELDFSFNFQSKHRFRGNAYLQREAVAAAFRLIPDKIPTLGELGLPPVVEDLTLRYQGLILITGPTGQGKSTTQAAMIEAINRTRRSHIITVEDPIEYLHQNQQSIVDQREVGPDTHSFGSALKHVLRQNPDVILVGEMRDIETVQAVLTAAETGHLVISTLHTNDAVQAVDRVLDIFAPHQQGQARSQLALSLVAVIAQRLVRKTDKTGRVLALEIMMNTPAVGNLIREGRVHQIYSIMETQAKEGMVTLDNSLKDLYLRGKIDKDEARARMRDVSCLDRMG